MRLCALVLAFTAVAASSCGGQADVRPGPVPDVVGTITAERLTGHMRALGHTAERNGGTRATGTPGWDESVDYVVRTLGGAGFRPELIPFAFRSFRELAPPVLRVTAAGRPVEAGEVVTMQYSGSGSVAAAPVVAVDLADPPQPDVDSTSGCEPGDFDAFPRGAVALVQRGGCFLAAKATNAERAGAAALVVMNDGTPGHTEAIQGTLGRPGVSIPVVGIGFDAGVRLAEAADPVRATVRVRVESRPSIAHDVVAEIRATGDEVVLLGAHLDSVPAGPGVNDDGSGVAALLETARALRNERPERTIRFAFWGAEELGLVGSTAYVDGLSRAERNRIVAVLNLDMVGSRNGGRFVFDGDGSSGGPGGPRGSDEIEQAILDAFRRLRLPAAPTALEPGRSDYAPFADAGIPVGGVFSGADGVKTPADAARFGGDAGQPYDPCYHRACDTAAGVDAGLAAELARVAALAALTLAGP